VERLGWLCVTCGTTNRSRWKMARHVQGVHIGSKKLACSLCQAAFATADSRQQHYRIKHSLVLTAREIDDLVNQN
jgi:hypothetical protein